jgi:dienelactone hydrolase
MFFLKQGADTVAVLLHEIYGINRFISETGRKFYEWGLDVDCPDLTGGTVYPYALQEQAYAHFIQSGGFGRYQEIIRRMEALRREYNKIILIGFSAGATIAWRCTESRFCDCMVGVYGSRIRDYTEVEPACRSLLLFSDQEESFDVWKLEEDLRNKKNASIRVLKGRHGFMDSFSGNFNSMASEKAMDMIRAFIQASDGNSVSEPRGL